jgi:hypothetical protein
MLLIWASEIVPLWLTPAFFSDYNFCETSSSLKLLNYTVIICEKYLQVLFCSIVYTACVKFGGFADC